MRALRPNKRSRWRRSLLVVACCAACDGTAPVSSASSLQDAGPRADGAAGEDASALRADAGLALDAPMARDAAASIDAGWLPDAGRTEDAAPPSDAGGGAVDAGFPEPTGLPRFRFPIHADDRASISTTAIFGVDHDPAVHTGIARYMCRDYQDRGFPWCYDEHDGSDFMLDGGFDTMDNGSARIVAAAGGVVTAVEDGHYDRCHTDLAIADVSCDGRPMRANSVTLRHADGWSTRYLHMKSGSVVPSVGDRVLCGAVLGLVGSSGYSSAPHLHFEVADAGGTVWDPFAGAFSQPESLWQAQSPGDGLPADVCDPAWSSPPP